MTRTGLDWRGQPANRIVSSYSCANMTVLLSFWIALNVSALVMIRLAWERGYLVTAEYYAPLIIFNASFWLYVACLTAKVRESIRNKYQIPDESCLGSEDYALATFCMPCTICQMGRHTADFDTYRATCCTGTGLPSHVELAPVSFYDDQYETMNDEHQAPFPPRQEMANIQLSSPHP
jgi:Cys-rich protein (TIGR01571 family)